MPTYTFSLSSDFPGGTIDELSLQTEAGADSVSTWGDVVTIVSSSDPSAAVAAHVPGVAVADASVTWATSEFRDLASGELSAWRGNAVRVIGEYKTGADSATLKVLENGTAIGEETSLPHSDGSWLPFSADFEITEPNTAAYTVQGQSPLFTTLQIRNASIKIVRI